MRVALNNFFVKFSYEPRNNPVISTAVTFHLVVNLIKSQYGAVECGHKQNFFKLK